VLKKDHLQYHTILGYFYVHRLVCSQGFAMMQNAASRRQHSSVLDCGQECFLQERKERLLRNALDVRSAVSRDKKRDHSLGTRVGWRPSTSERSTSPCGKNMFSPLLIFTSPGMRQEMGLSSFFSMEAQEMTTLTCERSPSRSVGSFAVFSMISEGLGTLS